MDHWYFPDIKTNIFMKIVDNDNQIFASLDQHQFVQPQTPRSDSQTATSGKMLVLLTRGLVVLDILRLFLWQKVRIVQTSHFPRRGSKHEWQQNQWRFLNKWLENKCGPWNKGVDKGGAWNGKSFQFCTNTTTVRKMQHEKHAYPCLYQWSFLRDLGFMIVLLILCNLPSAHSLHTKASEWTTCRWIWKSSNKFEKVKVNVKLKRLHCLQICTK